MNLCILNSSTKVCVNKIVVDKPEDFIPYAPNLEVAPDHTGEIGWVWNGDGWTNPNEFVLTPEEKAKRVRYKRNNLLRRYVDTLSPPRWEAMTQSKKDSWTIYRQALLDITDQEGFPFNVVWPTKPE